MKEMGITLQLISINKWPQGKKDPTEYSYQDNIIRIREDFDFLNDPCCWIIHETIHFMQRNIKYSNKFIYPLKENEYLPYVIQFSFLKPNIQFDSIFELNNMKQKEKYKKELKTYWNIANLFYVFVYFEFMKNYKYIMQ